MHNRIRTDHIISPTVTDVDAWTYFSGRLVNTTSEETKVSIRLPYKERHSIKVCMLQLLTCCYNSHNRFPARLFARYDFNIVKGAYSLATTMNDQYRSKEERMPQ